MGFSLVVEMLAEAKKPIVGHNMIYDILYLYNQFVDELPDTYIDFITKVIITVLNCLYSGTSYSQVYMITRSLQVLRMPLAELI